MTFYFVENNSLRLIITVTKIAKKLKKIKGKITKEKLKDIGLVKDKKISKKNNRDVYRDKDGNYYSVDTQHGRFEKTNSKGKHIDEYDFDFNSKGKTDKSGGHNLIVK